VPKTAINEQSQIPAGKNDVWRAALREVAVKSEPSPGCMKRLAQGQFWSRVLRAPTGQMFAGGRAHPLLGHIKEASVAGLLHSPSGSGHVPVLFLIKELPFGWEIARPEVEPHSVHGTRGDETGLLESRSRVFPVALRDL